MSVKVNKERHGEEVPESKAGEKLAPKPSK
jgi:hypothetical protein